MEEGIANITVTSNDVDYEPLNLMYSEFATPLVTSVSPTSGRQGDVITINGTRLLSSQGATHVTVSFSYYFHTTWIRYNHALDIYDHEHAVFMGSEKNSRKWL